MLQLYGIISFSATILLTRFQAAKKVTSPETALSQPSLVPKVVDKAAGDREATATVTPKSATHVVVLVIWLGKISHREYVKLSNLNFQRLHFWRWQERRLQRW